ncbi:MAG: transposase, partial [Candidatus Aenigmatarchaeota archaeon]
TLVLDLYFKGVSLRKIQDHLLQFYNFRITHVTIYNWIKKYMKMIEQYTNTLKPKISGMWNVDEQMIKAKGKYVYC